MKRASILAAVILFCLSCNNSLMTALNEKVALSEKDAPVPGGGGVLTVGTPRATVIPLSWQKATDAISAQPELQYMVVWSLLPNVDTAANAVANGTVAVDWMANIGSCDVTGLPILSTCYLNVLVKDRAGNIAGYTNASGLTTDDTTNPVAGNSGILQTNVATMDVFRISWTIGTDDLTPQSALTYQAFYSKTNNLNGTADQVIANGAPFPETLTPVPNIAAIDGTGLDDSVLYYVNVVVRDEKGNKTAYATASDTTMKHPRIYVTDAAAGAPAIMRADTDGSSLISIVPTGLVTPSAIAVDPVDRKVYWIDIGAGNKTLKRANFDGSSVETLINSGINVSYGIAIDWSSSGRKLYWTDFLNSTVSISDLPPPTQNGVDYIVLTNASDGIDQPMGIDVDQSTGEFYWVEKGTSPKIRKAPRTSPSGNITSVVYSGYTPPPSSALFYPADIAVDYVNHAIYWTDIGDTGDQVPPALLRCKAYAAGTTIQDLITTGLTIPCGASLEFRAGGAITVYWADRGNARIYKAPSFSSTAAIDYVMTPTSIGAPVGFAHY